MSDSINIKCENCRAWQRYRKSDEGRCYRFPPSIAISPNHVASHPLVKADDFCGEFVKKIEAHTEPEAEGGEG